MKSEPGAGGVICFPRVKADRAKVYVRREEKARGRGMFLRNQPAAVPSGKSKWMVRAPAVSKVMLRRRAFKFFVSKQYLSYANPLTQRHDITGEALRIMLIMCSLRLPHPISFAVLHTNVELKNEFRRRKIRLIS